MKQVTITLSDEDAALFESMAHLLNLSLQEFVQKIFDTGLQQGRANLVSNLFGAKNQKQPFAV